MKNNVEQIQTELSLIQTALKEQSVIVNVMSVLDEYSFINKKYELAWNCLKTKAQSNEEGQMTSLDDIIDAVRQGNESLSQDDVYAIMTPCYNSLLSVAKKLLRFELTLKLLRQQKKF